MNRIDLASPVPRGQVLLWKPIQCDRDAPHYMIPPDSMSAASLWEVIDSRSSRRSFGPLDEKALSSLLWYSAKTRRIRRDNDGRTWESRPTPSAGGIHSIAVVVVDR